MAKHDMVFIREKEKLYISMATDLPSVTTYFVHECESEDEAELLMRYLKKRQWDALKAIRRAEFFSGWRHAKAKKHGMSFFRRFMCNLRDEESHRF